AQSTRPGMGSVPYEGGVTFRVWAPHAEQVGVAGAFNGYDPAASPLAPEGDGLWSADVPGAAVGDDYRYVIRGPSGLVTRRDPHSRVVTSSHYENGRSLVYDPDAYAWGDAGFSPPALEDLVVYEMHVGTYHDAPGGGPGTFWDAIERLDHLADLGVTAVEVLPVTERPEFVPSDYGPSDLFAVENGAYGGPDAFKAFVEACHARGIAVILDVVYNHWGPWDLATHRFDGWHTPEWPGGIYFYDAERIDSPWGPRPNYGREEVRRYILDNLRMWVEEYHVDGFRWDATHSIYTTGGGDPVPLPDGWSLMQEANDALRADYPGLVAIAEDLTNEAALTRPTADGGAGFDAQWHYFAAHLRSELRKRRDDRRSMPFVAQALEHTYNGDFRQRVIYTESHNEPCCGGRRLTVEIDEDDPYGWAARKRSTLGAALLFTSPGIPMLWQGQELLDPTPFDGRTPMRWRGYAEHPGIVALYRDLIRLRLGGDGTTRGLRGAGQDVYVVDDARKVIAVHRWDAGGPGDDVVVVANFSGDALVDAPLGLPRPGRWLVRFNSDDPAYSPDFGGVGGDEVEADGPPAHGMAQSGRLSVGPYSALIFSQAVTTATEPDALPGGFALSAPSPNPFRIEARFSLSVAAPQHVRVEAFDATGRRVALLHDGPLAAGHPHEIALEAGALPAGVYLVRATGEAFVATRTAVLMR
ncbi:MAG TPA: alpha-amylase family glycosyl hydrolase, partial [Rubricoccaceae bacterium]|nr:alpha-amylase family glycosyl hydrolase [Rubricoccaceae bacterium]